MKGAWQGFWGSGHVQLLDWGAGHLLSGHSLVTGVPL